MKLILIILFSITISSLPAQNIAGKWITYSTVWRGKEKIENDKKEKTRLFLKNDSTYIKRYWKYDLPGDPTTMRLTYSLLSKDTRVRVLSGTNDGDRKIVKKIKVVERGTYSLRRSSHQVLFSFKGKGYSEHYTVENDHLVFRISTEGIINSTEKYFFIKFKSVY